VDLQQEIYTEVKGMRVSVNELNIRVTSLEIEMKALCNRANGIDSSAAKRIWSRADKFMMLGLAGGWIFGITTMVLSLCHAI